MQLIVPYLFPPTRLREAVSDIRVPAFEKLLVRGQRSACAAEGIEALLCNALGITRQQDYPIAPITLQYDGGAPGTDYWLRADPVHLRVMRERIVLAETAWLELDAAEAESLAHSIRAHFGAAFSPQVLHPARWYLRLDSAPQLHTTPLSLAVGCDIDPLLPQGEDAMAFRAQLNELQMLLFEHPVNQAREACGALPVNSLWLWGGGLLPLPRTSTQTIYTDDIELAALARFCGAPPAAPPARFDAALLKPDAVVVLEHLKVGGQYGDAIAWRDAMIALERDWFAPLLAYLRWHSVPLQLIDPVNGEALDIQRFDTWKIWRRAVHN